MAKRSAFSRIVREVKASIRQERLLSRALKYRPRFKNVARLPVALKNCYFITTDKGIFKAAGEQLTQITPWGTYGFAIHGDYAYCAVTVKKWSILLKCKLSSFLTEDQNPEWTELLRYEAPDTNCRFHGMDCDSKYLWLAHTGRGSLVKFDLSGKDPSQETPIFLDHFGKPIQYDLNHINGVTAYEQFTLFTAYMIGDTSGIGILEGDEVTAFAVPNTGIHDAYFVEDDIYHCDTFGSQQQGYLMCNNEAVDPEYFDTPPGFIIRGAAGDRTEMLVGHSHKGERKNRFKGSGSILFLNDHKTQAKLDFQGSQIYQIIREDGIALAPKPKDISPSYAKTKLTQVFGEPVYKKRVTSI